MQGTQDIVLGILGKKHVHMLIVSWFFSNRFNLTLAEYLDSEALPWRPDVTLWVLTDRLCNLI